MAISGIRLSPGVPIAYGGQIASPPQPGTSLGNAGYSGQAVSSLLPVASTATVSSVGTFFSQMLRWVEEGVADVVVALSNIPVLANLGYWLYGAVTKPHTDTPVVPNEGRVATNLMRGGQPTEKGFETLKSQGVQTVINLRPEETWEEPEVKNLGMKYIYFPLPAVGAPSIQQGLQFLSMATDPANGEIFFHCQHGADRTGAMAAAYRIAVDGWSSDQAIAEMMQYNFHTGFEDAKLDFVRSFEAYWNGLSSQAKNAILHHS